MKTYRKELWFNTQTRRELINITSQVEQCLAESGVKEGLCLVNAMHITATPGIKPGANRRQTEKTSISQNHWRVMVSPQVYPAGLICCYFRIWLIP
jgi:hypothetical protein